ncbi:type II toxin-antitoxin system RelE/ParE family toxin [Candidatus Uhrbacteria bacterium]|nr:type II toxin-antitoxin system RelE/ParE family toxin [Candidatus Uhrbacteria bacterium]
MIRVQYDRAFLKAVKKLPVKTQQRLAETIVTLQENPFHPTLHTKRLSGSLTGTLSYRVTRDYRVTFLFLDESTIQLLAVDHRKDIYR